MNNLVYVRRIVAASMEWLRAYVGIFGIKTEMRFRHARKYAVQSSSTRVYSEMHTYWDSSRFRCGQIKTVWGLFLQRWRTQDVLCWHRCARVFEKKQALNHFFTATESALVSIIVRLRVSRDVSTDTRRPAQEKNIIFRWSFPGQKPKRRTTEWWRRLIADTNVKTAFDTFVLYICSTISLSRPRTQAMCTEHTSSTWNLQVGDPRHRTCCEDLRIYSCTSLMEGREGAKVALVNSRVGVVLLRRGVRARAIAVELLHFFLTARLVRWCGSLEIMAITSWLCDNATLGI